MELVSERKSRIGFSKNASTTGLLCASRGSFEVGEVVTVRLRDPRRRDRDFRLRGRVVRCRRLSDGDLWRHEVAVRLDVPLGGPEPLG